MAVGAERGSEAGLRDRLVGGVGFYVERPAVMPGAGDAARIENLIAELEAVNAASAQTARAGYAQLRALLTEPAPAEERQAPGQGRLARLLRRAA